MAQTLLDLNPSLALIPSAYKAEKLYSLIPADGSGDFDVSRNGSATRVNKNGLIESVATNVPRFEFDPITGDFLGVLVEPSASNLLPRSEEFDTIIWNKFNSTVQANTDIAPNGTLSFDKLIENSANTIHSIFRSVSVALNTVCTFSVFVKKSSKRWISIAFGQGGAPSRAFFDLDNNVFGTVSSGITELSKNYGNGIYRLSISLPSSATTPVAAVELANDNNLLSYQGDGTGSVLIWGAQLETGSVATSYIPTTNEAVTRPADIITVTVPAGATEVVYVNNGVQTTLPVTGGSTFQLPVGLISKLWMN